MTARTVHTARVETRDGQPVPDLVSSVQRKRAAELELMHALQTELLRPVPPPTVSPYRG